MNLQLLNKLMLSGQFHHATYRNVGSLWEGLWIYTKYAGARGFQPAGCFGKESPELDAALEATKHTGVSVGSYGQG